jgi:hypothetical protein
MPKSKEQTEDQLYAFLAGYAYADPGKNVKEITSKISYNAMPPDIAALLGALERNDRQTVVEWFGERGCKIEKGKKASDVVISTLLHSWQVTLANRLRRSLEISQVLTPGELISHCEGIIESLKNNGIKKEPFKTEKKPEVEEKPVVDKK